MTDQDSPPIDDKRPPNQRPGRPKTRGQLLAEFITERFLSLLAVIAIIALAIWYIGPDITVGRQARIFFLVVLILTPTVGFPFASWVRSRLEQDAATWLVDVDVRDHQDAAIYRFPGDTVLDLEVTDGELAQAGPSLLFGKDFDPEEMTVKGVWLGTLDDRDLMTALQRVDECRNILEEDAKRGFAIESNLWSIVRKATRRTTLSVVNVFEDGTLPDDGDGLGEAIESALDSYNIEDVVRSSDDDLVDQIGDDLPDDLGDSDAYQAVDSDDFDGDPLSEVSADD